MPYITSIERMAQEEGWKEGREEGLRKGIAAVMEVRFGESGLTLMQEIEPIDKVDILQTILDRARTVATPDQLRECWQ